jgi:hypothetical protein
MQLSTAQYNLLERAIAKGMRIAVFRRGSEYIVVPKRLSIRTGRETLETRQPSTGDDMTIYLDEIDAFEVVGD